MPKSSREEANNVLPMAFLYINEASFVEKKKENFMLFSRFSRVVCNCINIASKRYIKIYKCCIKKKVEVWP